MTRTWIIPATEFCSELDIYIHEPPLTEDNIGLKTWASSYLLAKRLESLGHTHLKTLRLRNHRFQALELGAGTGLVGIAAAAIWGCHTHVTDLPDIVPNLALNAENNIPMLEKMGGTVTAAVLDWGNDPVGEDVVGAYDVSPF